MMIVLMVNCTVCQHEFHMGESVAGHAFKQHPRLFINAILNSSIGEDVLTFLIETMLANTEGTQFDMSLDAQKKKEVEDRDI
jgi:hypothetical protein